MHKDIAAYNASQSEKDTAICDLLASLIDGGLAATEAKVWHGHPVWFIHGNPIVGYSKQKPGIRLMFWSGADFEEPELDVLGKKFKDASRFYTEAEQVDPDALARWLRKGEEIQWDYANLAKRKGRLEKLQ